MCFYHMNAGGPTQSYSSFLNELHIELIGAHAVESINSLTNKCIDKLISTGGISLELFALYAGENITALKQKEVH